MALRWFSPLAPAISRDPEPLARRLLRQVAQRTRTGQCAQRGSSDHEVWILSIGTVAGGRLWRECIVALEARGLGRRCPRCRRGGGQEQPEAGLHLKRSQDQLAKAKVVSERSEGEAANRGLARAKVDADFAIALTNQATARRDAEAVLTDVRKEQGRR